MMSVLEGIFIWVLEKSLPAAVVVLVILILRTLLMEYPKKYVYVLWAALAVRLLWFLPTKNRLSLFHLGIFKSDLWRRADTIPQLVGNQEGISGTGMAQLSMAWQANEMVKTPALNQDLWPKLFFVGTLLWFLGVMAFAVYFIMAYNRMRRSVCCSVRLRGNIYECDAIGSPFVMGIIHPRIYLPFRIDKEQQAYIICHEQYHIRRRDHLVKLLAFFLLAVYWFHPLIWLSYFLMCRDMEMSCDEGVLEQLGMESKKDYSTALLKFASGGRLPGNLLGFGEGDAHNRILHILQFRPIGKAAAEFLSLLCVMSVMILGCEAAREGKDGSNDAAKVTEAAQEFYAAKTPYLGDASAVGKLLSLLEGRYLPKAERAVRLDSREEPYVLRLSYKEAPENEEEQNFQIAQGATLLLALVDNLGEVQWVYPKPEAGQEVMITVYWDLASVAAMLPDVPDIKEYGESAGSLSKLLEMLDGIEIEEAASKMDADTIPSDIQYVGGADGFSKGGGVTIEQGGE